MHAAGVLWACAALAACSAAPVTGGAPQARTDLYQCEGCDGALEREASRLAEQARMAPEGEAGEPLEVSGTVYRTDGRTPAGNIVIYAYQTNAAGLYANGSDETEWSRRHGNLRGWVRTGADGRFAFTTVKPAPYPGNTMPAHIHLTVLEPGKRPYWIDDIVFDGEFGVTDAYRARMENRGGNGIVPLQRGPSGLAVTRDIVLERHPS